jgi:hypothetical protein
VIPFAVSSLGQAGIALGSAVIGGLLTSSTTFWVETSRAKREAEAASQRDNRELQTAGRLVLEELMDVLASLKRAQHDGHYWPRPDRQLPADVWTHMSPILARYLDTHTWLDTSTAYALAVNALNWRVRDRESQAETLDQLRALPVLDEDRLPDKIESVDKAMSSLGKVVGALDRKP